MDSKKILITGGAGFIGYNTALYFHKHGYQVHILDNLSRKGTDLNWKRLQNNGIPHFHQKDIRDGEELKNLFEKYSFDIVIHLAGQVAVTTSVVDPREDFEINALGTFNLLEAARNLTVPPIFIYSSTNKVYGEIKSLEVIEKENRYSFQDRIRGISEAYTLDFHSPYGCSKGAADQYVIDYYRIYGIKSAVFRQSCIYGEYQFGVEDQGWVAWFLIRHALGKAVTIYGDGKQGRDVLYVNDLVRLYHAAIEGIDKICGEAFNVGGGLEYSLSLLELINLLEEQTGRRLAYAFDDWRPGDQKIYISDNSKIQNSVGWTPTTEPPVGIKKLYTWITENLDMIQNVLG